MPKPSNSFEFVKIQSVIAEILLLLLLLLVVVVVVVVIVVLGIIIVVDPRNLALKCCQNWVSKI